MNFSVFNFNTVAGSNEIMAYMQSINSVQTPRTMHLKRHPWNKNENISAPTYLKYSAHN